jgi:hypothetical protein
VRAGGAESQEELCHLVVVLGGRLGVAGNPVEDVGVGAVEQGLVPVELRVVKSGKVLIGEAAEDQVAFPRAAAPGTEQQPLAANL